jgi:hypothetical protein
MENNTNVEAQIKSFIEYWQKFITQWIEYSDSNRKLLNSFIKSENEYYKFGSIHNTLSNYFPEPYFGNPSNIPNGNIYAVFINLNPGSAGTSQSHYNEGGYIDDFRSNGSNYLQTLNYWNNEYYQYLENLQNNKEIRHHKNQFQLKKKPNSFGTMDWWDKHRAKWIDSFLKPDNVTHKIEIQHILGLELSPWHSKVFTDIKDINIDFAIEMVVKRAVEFSKHINNHYLREENKSLVLTCGAGFKNFFKAQNGEQITPNFLDGKWRVWKWQFDDDTSIINFHQTNTKGAVTLNFPNKEIFKEDLQLFLVEQLKAMLA